MKLSFWQYTTIGLLLIVILLTACNACQRSKIVKLEKDCGEKLVRVDTVTRHDTINVPFDSYVYVPQPYEVEKPVPVYVLGEEVIREVDTANILKDYFSTAKYKNNHEVIDSNGRKAGNVTIEESITQNRIAERRVYGNLIHDSVTSYITRTVEAKQKNSVWLGINGQWSNGVQSVGPSLFFMQKKGWGIEAGSLINTKGELSYQAGLKFRFK